MKCAQHAAHNPKVYSNIHSGGNKYIKGLAHMVEGDHHLRKAPKPHPRALLKKKTVL